jgi:ABC-type amino acid transport system permease subunit
MEQMRFTYNELITYLALLGIVLGILLGLIPLILGLKRNKRSYGLFGLVTSIIAGVFSPILSIIVVAIFTWLILRKPKNEPVDVRVVNETPIDVKVENSENR